MCFPTCLLSSCPLSGLCDPILHSQTKNQALWEHSWHPKNVFIEAYFFTWKLSRVSVWSMWESNAWYLSLFTLFPLSFLTSQNIETKETWDPILRNSGTEFEENTKSSWFKCSHEVYSLHKSKETERTLKSRMCILQSNHCMYTTERRTQMNIYLAYVLVSNSILIKGLH